LTVGWKPPGSPYGRENSNNKERSGFLRKQKPLSFDDLLLELQGQKASKEDPSMVALDDLFNSGFMSRHSGFGSFREFMEKGSFQATTHEEVGNLMEELLNRHVARHTDFRDYPAMLKAATDEFSAE